MDNNLLSMLGLAKKAGMLTVGEEPVESVVRAKDARVLFLARDAAENTTRRCLHFAEVGNCLWLRVPFTKDEMGWAVGRTSVALAAMTDIGFAAAFVRRLAQQDPGRYADAAERLELKAQRAAQRKAEQRAHERNIRTGKVRPRAAVEPPPPPPPAPAKEPRAQHHRPKSGGHPPAAGKRGERPAGHSGGPGRAKPSPYAHSRPVKKGKGSFRKKEG